ncbi:complex I NDUFA9 subunit family protein [Brevundimonas subvibrioides]|uniref:NAD-dependent epimerase/dehydratase n=1 Tax=Brevundimonas subvibrioides (strain ATCC 15264 / DSM 4735 / LMG 14903 / NBRC 16000 / CB 81) TaxID=633149 RepID=D9QLZ9_BRESC|nr:complex I NDUFA9 subunit family protein [Brevundimonas subvibrioides]ADL00083.1 NAD-dependent epimerase/dehydratase [Brevundimonas subvibrioides ATCC 15264]
MSEFSPGLVTVFGGSGFVGTQAVRALAKRGWRVRVAVRKPHLAQDLRILGDVGQIQPVRCDITRPADVAAALKGADAAVNLVGLLFEAPGRGFDAAHVEGTRNIAGACEAAGVARFVHVSAIGADVNSEADYGRSKGEAEAAARTVKPDTVILRPSIVFGTGDGFLNRFAAMAGTAPALPLIGGGKTKFQPVWVGDVAEAIARSVTRIDAAARTFELGGPEVWSFKDILKYILRETGKSRLLAPLPVFVAATMGRVMQLSSLVGIAPVLTRDQVLMLKVDNVVAPGAEGLAALGIEPTGLEAIAPSYLWRYRRGGQFAANPPAMREEAA